MKYLFALEFALIVVFYPVRDVLAHGEDPRLEISAERLNPGSVIEIRGVAFVPEETVRLVLVGATVELDLIEVITDAEGTFFLGTVLPVDLPEGEYHLRAVSSDHELLSPALTISGLAADEETGGQGPRDEDEGLLAPMPTYSPDSSMKADAAAPIAVAVAQTIPVENEAGSPDVAVIALTMLVGVVVVMGGWRWMRRG